MKGCPEPENGSPGGDHGHVNEECKDEAAPTSGMCWYLLPRSLLDVRLVFGVAPASPLEWLLQNPSSGSSKPPPVALPQASLRQLCLNGCNSQPQKPMGNAAILAFIASLRSLDHLHTLYFKNNGQLPLTATVETVAAFSEFLRRRSACGAVLWGLGGI